VEYQRIAAAGFFFLPSTDAVVPFGGLVSWNGAGMGAGGFVFGTLLGPEATGPCMRVGRFLEEGAACRCGRVCLFLVSWLHRSHGCAPLCGVVCGVCGMGLLFENYIVDASIFYKKQFPRI